MCHQVAPVHFFSRDERDAARAQKKLPRCRACVFYSEPPYVTLYKVPPSFTDAVVRKRLTEHGLGAHLISVTDLRRDPGRVTPVRFRGYALPSFKIVLDKVTPELLADIRRAIPETFARAPQLVIKTKMCATVQRGLVCYWGDRCVFAHKPSEIVKTGDGHDVVELDEAEEHHGEDGEGENGGDGEGHDDGHDDDDDDDANAA